MKDDLMAVPQAIRLSFETMPDDPPEPLLGVHLNVIGIPSPPAFL